MKFIHSDQVKYNLESVTTDAGRYYKSPKTGVWYPSVTTVVGHADRDKFKNWSKDPKNQAESKRTLDRGENLHLGIEQYLSNNVDYNKTLKSVNSFLFEQIREELDKIQNIRMQESALWSDDIFIAGRVDCVAEYDGKLSIIDFKGSTKEKKESYIQGYFEQTTLYSIMYKEVYGESISSIVIMITAEDGSSQIFQKSPKDYVHQAVEKYRAYWKDHKLDLIQEKVKQYNDRLAKLI